MFAGALLMDDANSTPARRGGSGRADEGQYGFRFRPRLVFRKDERCPREIWTSNGQMSPQPSIKSLAYEGGSYSSKKLDAAYKAAQRAYRENVYALSCGEGFSGLLSSYQAKFWLLGNVVPHKSEKNDGMVEFQSCAVGFPESKFGNTYRDRFYRNKLNHFDMQFLAGDSTLNKAKMPVKWFECLL